MEVYRYQQLAYLVVPVMLGMEFFLSAQLEKKGKGNIPLGFYILDFLGFIFMALLPAIFIFTIWAIETKAFPMQMMQLAKLDRYAVMFFFMGAWWQVYIFAALRARRMKQKEYSRSYLWLPFMAFGIYISFLVLWVSPFGMKWISLAWFLFIFGLLHLLRAKTGTIERTMWILAAITFLAENLLFIWMESIV